MDQRRTASGPRAELSNKDKMDSFFQGCVVVTRPAKGEEPEEHGIFLRWSKDKTSAWIVSGGGDGGTTAIPTSTLLQYRFQTKAEM